MEDQQLLGHFTDLLEDRMWELTQTGADPKALAAYSKNVDLLQKNHCRKDHKFYLLRHCHMVARKGQDLSRLSLCEKQVICNLTWQSWDNTVHLAAFGTEEELSEHVAGPQSFVANRKDTV